MLLVIIQKGSMHVTFSCSDCRRIRFPHLDGSAGTSVEGHLQVAEGLLFRALSPIVQAVLLEAPCTDESKADLKRLQQLVDLPAQQVPIPCSGHQTIPDMSRLAPPVHLPIEKERARLQVSLPFPRTFFACAWNCFSLAWMRMLKHCHQKRHLADCSILQDEQMLLISGCLGFLTVICKVVHTSTFLDFGQARTSSHPSQI